MKALCGHRHVVHLKDTVEEANEIHIVMNYASGGDVLTHVMEKGRFSEERSRRIFLEVLDALHYAHALGFVHRDLKLGMISATHWRILWRDLCSRTSAENILFDSDGSAIVADWGFACAWSPDKLLKGAFGTPHYCSPEIAADTLYRGPEVDAWSLGILLYTFVTGCFPFSGDEKSIKAQIRSGRMEIPSYVSPSCASLIRGLCNVDPQRRFTLEQAAAHPFANPSAAPCLFPGATISYTQLPPASFLSFSCFPATGTFAPLPKKKRGLENLTSRFRSLLQRREGDVDTSSSKSSSESSDSSVHRRSSNALMA
jgi:serine/threonine protein kinase